LKDIHLDEKIIDELQFFSGKEIVHNINEIKSSHCSAISATLLSGSATMLGVEDACKINSLEETMGFLKIATPQVTHLHAHIHRHTHTRSPLPRQR
jgi:hypothetical protein